MKLLRHLPNVLTLCNLLFGTIAILILPQGHFEYVLLLVGGCLLADILDGAMARRLGIASSLGIQLDSLADLVSFGVLPALILAQFPFIPKEQPFLRAIFLVLPALVAVSAGLRLARFNVDTRPREYFWGLPTPAGGVMVTALGWAYFLADDLVHHLDKLYYSVLFLCVFLIVFYQAPLKLPGLKSPKPGLITIGVMAALVLVGFVFLGPISISLGILLYVMAGVVNLVLRWY